jgi:hypothetical protein
MEVEVPAGLLPPVFMAFAGITGPTEGLEVGLRVIPSLALGPSVVNVGLSGASTDPATLLALIVVPDRILSLSAGI